MWLRGTVLRGVYEYLPAWTGTHPVCDGEIDTSLDSNSNPKEQCDDGSGLTRNSRLFIRIAERNLRGRRFYTTNATETTVR